MQDVILPRVGQELIDDNEVEYDPEDPDGDVVYVSYTEPQSKEEYAKNPDEPWNDTTVDDMIAKEEAEEAEETHVLQHLEIQLQTLVKMENLGKN